MEKSATNLPKAPWDFGIKPSKLLERTKLRFLKDKIMEDADFVYGLTLKSPPPVNVAPELSDLLRRFVFKLELKDALLVASHCKPLSIVYTENGAKAFESALKEHGLVAKARYSTDNLEELVFVGFSEDIVDFASEFFVKFLKIGKQKNKFHLCLGLILGYPVGDAVAFSKSFRSHHYKRFKDWCRKHRYNYDLSLLTHVPTPYGWSAEWAKKVGIRGEEKLAGIYKQYLEGSGFFQEKKDSPKNKTVYFHG